MEPKDRIIVPLDVSSVWEARDLVDLLAGHVGMFKIGLEFVWATIASILLAEEKDALEILRSLRSLAGVISGRRAFIDAKLADIPNTIEKSSLAISSMGVRFLNIHASCGPEAIRKAVDNRGKSFVLGVTVLTSLSEENCISIFGDAPGIKVRDFARMLMDNGADGVICSPQELDFLRGFSLLKVTPGTRPIWAAKNDQKRIMTPKEAIRAGADYLVCGRPIIKPPDEINGPVEAARMIADEIASVS